MKHRIAIVSAFALLRVAAAVTAIVLFHLSASDALAGTLTDAKTPSQWSLPPPQALAKSPSTGHLKSCSSYGAGFAAVPGTDACVKVGGFLRAETTVH